MLVSPRRAPNPPILVVELRQADPMTDAPTRDPVTPARPSRVQRLLVRPLRAGALAGGGSAFGLAIAIALDDELGHRVPMAVWVACTAGACAAAILVGYPREPLTPQRVLRRALGVAVYGFALGGGPMALITEHLPRPRHDAASLILLGLTGLALLMIGLWGRLSRSLDVEVQASPGGLLPAAPPDDGLPGARFALLRSGPAVTAAEAEDDGLVTEVRVTWGGDLLHVEHVAPPRGFVLGDGGDFAVDTTPLGASALRLVRVEDDRVLVAIPRGATGMIERRAERVTLERAIDEGWAEREEEGPSVMRVPLRLESRVTLSLPLRAAAIAYRAAQGEHDPADARVVVEVALVRAGRVVGRELSFEGAGRMALSAAVPLGMAGAFLVLVPRLMVPLCGTCEEPSAEVKEFLYQQLIPMAEADLEPPQDDPSAEPPRPTWERRERQPWREVHWRLEPDAWLHGIVSQDRPFDLPADAWMLAPSMYCWGEGAPLEDPELVRFPGARRLLCESPVISPFGLRAFGAPLQVDLLGRDPGDAWSPLFARAIRAAPRPSPAPHGHVATRVEAAFNGVAPSVIERLLHERQGALRACLALAQRYDPEPWGAIDLRLIVDATGVVTSVSQVGVRRLGQERPDEVGVAAASHAGPCVAAALRGARFPAAAGRLSTPVVTIELRPNGR